MNFLAHIFLSGNDPEVLVGNFIGDFVKGKQVEAFPAAVRKGIWLHREIDEYTDRHPVVLESKERLRPQFSHYAPVVSDMYYDHFLALDWHVFSSHGLSSFVEKAYQTLQNHAEMLPPRAQYMLPHMVRYNWLEGYQYLEGLNQAFEGMARRTTFRSRMEHAVQVLKQDYEAYRAEFHRFFPDLQQRCTDFLSEYEH